MGFLYLRYLIGGLNVAFVVLVACLTLSLALTISFKSLRDNADTAVSRLGSATAKQVDAFFASPQRRLADLATANMRFAGLGTFPSESPTFGAVGSAASAGGEVLQSYRQLMTAMMVEAEFHYVTTTIMFYDGSYIWQIIGKPLLAVVTTWPTGPFPTQQHPLVFSGHTIPGAVELPQATAQITALFSTYNFVTDGRIPQVPAALAFMYAAGTRSKGSPVSWGELYFTAVNTPEGVKEYFFLWLGCPVVNRTGTNLGFAVLVLRTDDVSAILTEGQLTPATRLVVYDVDGYLFGASSGVGTYVTEPFVGATTDPGCTTTNQSAAQFPSDFQRRACRYHLRDSPLSIVRDAARKDLSFFMQPSTAGVVKLIGAQYVYVQRLPTLEGKRAFTIAMVVPEEDMIGDAKNILPICAGVTGAVVLFVAALSFVVVWIVLRPLQSIAARMGKAARLEDDADDVAVSSLVEIGDLQRAFIEMRDELSRIRAFVPQSLLRANDDDYDEEDTVLDVDDVTADATPRPSPSPGATPTQRSIQDSGASSPVKLRHTAGENSSGQYVMRRRGSLSTDKTRESAGAKKGRGRLQLSASVRRENVSILNLNFRGYHSAVKEGLDVDKVAATVDIVFRIAKQEKGVVDSFHGDRFSLSFNAVKPAANHGIRAAIVASRIAVALSDEQSAAAYALPMVAGVGTGAAQVGNLGSSEMKRFSIVGPVVSQAACLERLCKLYPGATCLVPQRLFADLRTAVLVKTVDYVRVPFQQQPVLIGAVLRELSQAGDDEWMYQLQQAAEEGAHSGSATDFTSTGAAYTQANNTVWDALYAGQVGDAFDDFEAKADGQVSSVLRAAVSNTNAVGTLEPHDFGEFYSDAVLDSNQVLKL